MSLAGSPVPSPPITSKHSYSQCNFDSGAAFSVPSAKPMHIMQSSVESTADVPLHYHSLDERAKLAGNVTPPNGAPRRWWSGNSVSPGRNTVIDPSSELSLLPLSFSDLPSLSASKDLPILINSGVGDGGTNESLLLSAPFHSPASPAKNRTLKSLGIGIEEGLRNDNMEHSFWPRLLGRLTATPPIPNVTGTSTATLPLEESRVESMEHWDGKSLHVAPLSTVLVPLSSDKGTITASSSQAVASTYTGKDPHLSSEQYPVYSTRNIIVNHP